jgi:hypothetical protein
MSEPDHVICPACGAELEVALEDLADTARAAREQGASREQVLRAIGLWREIDGERRRWEREREEMQATIRLRGWLLEKWRPRERCEE